MTTVSRRSVATTVASPMTLAVLLTALLALPLASVSPAHAKELVKNSLLTEMKGNRPKEWRPQAYLNGADAVKFTALRDTTGLGVLKVQALKQNDARWSQSIPVQPDTWYRVSGWVKAENVGGRNMGAYISVMGTFHNSEDLRGNRDWTQVGFWVKTAELDTKIEVACRLGGYSSLNVGTAWCAGISVIAAGKPDEGRGRVFGGDAKEETGDEKLWVQVMAVMVVIGLVLLLWRFVMPPKTHIAP